jgi:putative restriction endonuclease
LEKAKLEGFSTQARFNDEIAVAFRPDFFISYVLGAEQLHHTKGATIESQILEKAITGETVEEDFPGLESKERRTVIQNVLRRIRDGRFRTKVLRAYSHRCCICGLQLDLLDAAHIIPVDHKRGTDETKNGLSLCALHHRAFDHALIAVKPDYAVVCSERSFSELRAIGWEGGEPEFRAALRDQILLPPKREIYPDPDYLRFGQEIRCWTS